MDFGSLQTTRIPLFNVRHRAARLAWAHESVDPAYQVGKVAQSWSGVFFRGTAWHLWCLYYRSTMQFRSLSYWGSPPTVYAVLISSRGNGVFQQDNCTSRNSRMVNGWLDEPFSDFSVINGPSRGPDLNPIEHLFCVIFNKA
ncbi:juvenile hormone acid O-methyltransferase [Trichonephila clavipes]|nr:juvenile hormone acid O-methyltransferase [Trichonephila clavipes]